MMPPIIITTFWAKPIPDRRFDWVAYYDGTEESMQYGYGASEQEAIDDLRLNFPGDEG